MKVEIMNDELRLLEWLLGGEFTILSAIISWMWRWAMTKQQTIEKDLVEHKLDMARNYVTNMELRNTVQDFKETVTSFHRRMDEFFDKVNHNIKR